MGLVGYNMPTSLSKVTSTNKDSKAYLCHMLTAMGKDRGDALIGALVGFALDGGNLDHVRKSHVSKATP